MMYSIESRFAVATKDKRYFNRGYQVLKAYYKLGLISDIRKYTEKVDGEKKYFVAYMATTEMQKRIENEFRMNF